MNLGGTIENTPLTSTSGVILRAGEEVVVVKKGWFCGRPLNSSLLFSLLLHLFHFSNQFRNQLST